jgi:RNA polymerase sigma-70 factor (ECF subfamily)
MDQAPDELEADARLMRRAVREPDAFGLIYERYYALILNYAFRRTLSVSAAEEVASNTFFKALRALPKYRAEQPIKAWLYRIASNELRMHWRWRRRHPALSLGELESAGRVVFDQRGLGAGLGAVIQHEEREQRLMDFARLHQALARLPQRYQTIIALRYFEHLSLEQIAQVTDRPLGSVKSRLHRALARLRAAVTHDPPGEFEAGSAAAARASS